jgi:hypothetical protein
VAIYTKGLLSGSTNGLGIKVAATGTAGTLVHTAVAGTTNYDEIWLWAVNTDATSKILTIEYGGVGDPDDHIEVTLAVQEGAVIVIPGLILQNAKVVRAFADAANVVIVFGYINRITS